MLLFHALQNGICIRAQYVKWAVNMKLSHVITRFSFISNKLMLRRKEYLHAGDTRCCHEPACRTDAASNSTHENCDTIHSNVSKVTRICHEHHAETDQQTGIVCSDFFEWYH